MKSDIDLVTSSTATSTEHPFLFHLENYPDGRFKLLRIGAPASLASLLVLALAGSNGGQRIFDRRPVATPLLVQPASPTAKPPVEPWNYPPLRDDYPSARELKSASQVASTKGKAKFHIPVVPADPDVTVPVEIAVNIPAITLPLATVKDSGESTIKNCSYTVERPKFKDETTKKDIELNFYLQLDDHVPCYKH
jgi:hypothetical protein